MKLPRTNGLSEVDQLCLFDDEDTVLLQSGRPGGRRANDRLGDRRLIAGQVGLLDVENVGSEAQKNSIELELS